MTPAPARQRNTIQFEATRFTRRSNYASQVLRAHAHALDHPPPQIAPRLDVRRDGHGRIWRVLSQRAGGDARLGLAGQDGRGEPWSAWRV
jgi:hypothetical protein